MIFDESETQMHRLYVRWAFVAFVLVLVLLFNAGACAVTNNPFWWNGKRYNREVGTQNTEHFTEVK